MINLYDNYGKDYRKYCENYDILSQAKFKMFLNELVAMEENSLDDDQKEFLAQFYRFNPLLNTSCEINNISAYMQKRMSEIKASSKLLWSKDMIEVMKKQNISGWDDAKSDALISLHEKYKSEKRNFGNIKNEDGDSRWQTIEQYNKSIRQEALRLSSDMGELAYYAIARCYVGLESDNKAFVWNIFGDGVVDNIKKNVGNKKIEIPFLDEDGDIEYLGKRYSRREIKIASDDIYDFL